MKMCMIAPFSGFSLSAYENILTGVIGFSGSFSSGSLNE
jgi:hypothetical protein